MSAYICSTHHVVVLVHATNKLRYPPARKTHEECDAIATLLLKENVRSVNYRYKGRFKSNKVESLVPCPDGHRPRDLLALAKCLRYQSCEHPDYEKSKAFAALNELMVVIYEALVPEHLTETNVWSI